ncbi:GNAT family N-acetyltransferase [Streptomyces alkaliphilus]|uniref:GNAT family N-acetyltransferase n=1 Tax=Streptomyces alkaliphilus TaxID=1472722 RepID=UPI00117EA23E|nr:GNAT family N-acetyltransferase [Streptomyces alkaliphilus]MQS06085.1 GNAT family N-acetyltransferase [Streptomyces alkaliphilus]
MGTSVTIETAAEQDGEQILKLQYLCFQSDAERYGDYRLEPLTQTLDGVRAEIADGHVLVARLGDEIVGSVRAVVDADGTAAIGKLIVHPRMQRHGLGRRLLTAIEARLAERVPVTRYRLSTGHRGEAGLRLYRKVGYTPVATERVSRALSVITLEKSVPRSSAEGGTTAPADRGPLAATA